MEGRELCRKKGLVSGVRLCGAKILGMPSLNGGCGDESTDAWLCRYGLRRCVAVLLSFGVPREVDPGVLLLRLDCEFAVAFTLPSLTGEGLTKLALVLIGASVTGERIEDKILPGLDVWVKVTL